MTTRHLVDPEIAPMLDLFPNLSLTAESLPQNRAFLNEMLSQASATAPAFPDIDVSERHIPGPQDAPDVRVLVYLPKNTSTPTPALLWIHGGGYVMGNPDMVDLQVKNIVA
ncbi:MAG TPA: arylesterase, partial [Ktedonobacter sp.]|nr:arylesterase [Ktedonobacter sp.]